MPAAQEALLPLCIGLSLVGVVITVIAFARGRRGRAVQGLALALLPVALYLTGLLTLVWDAVVAIVRWATGNVFDLKAWVGFGLLAVCVVLWLVGGAVARRSRRRTRAVTAENKAQGQVSPGKAGPGQVTGKSPARTAAKGSAKQPVAQDDDMAEIEALLKSRGIQ